jgi:hypothetical protein
MSQYQENRSDITQYSDHSKGWKAEVWISFTITASSPGVGPIQPPIHWVSGIFSPEAKQFGYEADHSPPSNTEFMNA